MNICAKEQFFRQFFQIIEIVFAIDIIFLQF